MASRSAATVETPTRRRPSTRRPAETPARPRPKTRRPAAKPVAAPRRPAARTRRAPRARSRGGIALIAVIAVLLGGIVFVNLAVLRLNLRLDSATSLSSKLKAQNATFQSQLSAARSSGKIQSLAHSRDGLVEAQSIHYIDLSKKP